MPQRFLAPIARGHSRFAHTSREYAISAADILQPDCLEKSSAARRLQIEHSHSILTAAPTAILDTPHGAPSERYPPHQGLARGAQMVWPALVLFHLLLKGPQVGLEIRHPETLVPVSEDGQAWEGVVGRKRHQVHKSETVSH